jgi:16S rRNA (adenine(1408)-N(1))-methyltransferase
VGAGDGGYVLYRARTEPNTFAIALDASPDALSDGAWRAKRAHAANAAFLVEGLERIPNELTGLADEVTVHFPWGSLLRGLIVADERVFTPLAKLLKPDGELRLLLSATPRDGYSGGLTPDDLSALAGSYAEHGLELTEARVATRVDLVASHSSWAKRLGRGRPVVLARYSRRSSRSGFRSAGTASAAQLIHSTANRPS